MVAYRHRLNKNLIDALFKLYSCKDYCGVISKILDHNQIANFQKLKYWGLIEKTQVSGEWKLTYLGVEFIHGNKTMPEFVFSYRGEILATTIEDPQPKQVTFSSYLPYSYDKQPDYINSEKSLESIDQLKLIKE